MKSHRTGAAVAVLALSLLPAVGAAQTSEDQMRAHLERQRRSAPEVLPEDQIIVDRRQPIPFVPFEMVDIVTGEPIAHDQILELPDGKKMPARDYFRELNLIEQGLCEMGYSLRQDWKEITIQRSPSDPQKLRAGLRHISGAVDESKPFRLHTEADLDAALQPQSIDFERPNLAVIRPELGNLRPIELAPPAKPAERPRPELADKLREINLPPKKEKAPVLVNTSNEYPFQLGDPNVFAAGVTGKLDMAGSEDVLKLDGIARAHVSVFGISSDLARLNASLDAPKTGDMRGRVTFDVLPFGTIYDETLKGASVKLTSPDITRSVDIPFANFRVMLGPVPVKVEAGAHGELGMHYFAGLNPSSAVAEFAPIVRSNLYVSAGADYYVAGVGVETRLTLVNYDLSMYGELRLWMQIPEGGTKPEMGIREKYEISQKLQMLSGNAYVWAYVYYPSCCIPPWSKKEWKWELFNWEGFTPVDGNLADVTRWTSLGIKAP